MPFVEPVEKINSYVPDETFVPETEGQEPTGHLKTLSSAYALYNPVTSATVNESTLSVFDDYDSDYDPDEHMEGFEEHKDVLAMAKDETHMERLKNDIRRSKRYQNDITNAGTKGVVYSLASGLLDPIGLYTFGAAGQIIKAPKKIGKATKAAQMTKAAGKTAVAGAGSVALSEGVLQATQPALTAEDSIIAIGSGALLGGILGGAVKYVDFKRLDDLGNRLKKDFTNISPTVERLDAETNATIKAYNSTVGAAQVKKLTAEDLELVDSLGMARLARYVAPTLRVMQGSSEVAKNTYVKLAEVPLKLKGNIKGEATPVAAETAAKEYDKYLAQGVRATTEGYKKIKKESPEFKGYKGKVSYAKRISQAMRRNDTDIKGNDEITKIAQFLRKNFFNPIKDKAIRVGLLPEDIQAKFADSYLSRMWNPKRIIDNLHTFQAKLREWATKKTNDEILRINQNFDKSKNRTLSRIDKENDYISGNKKRISEIESRESTKFDYKSLHAVQDDYLEYLKRDMSLQDIGSYLSRYELEDVANLVNTAKSKIPQRPQGLVSAIVKAGGIKPDKELAARDITNKVRVGLFNKEGQSIDQIMPDLIDEGYFPHLKDNPDMPDEWIADDLRKAIEDDLFNGGVYRDEDISLVDDINRLEEAREEAIELLSMNGIADYNSFYKNIYEDIKFSKRDLRKATKAEKERIKTAKAAIKEYHKKTEGLRKELKRMRNSEVARLKRDVRKAETRIKKHKEKIDEMESAKISALNMYDDMDDIGGYVDDVVDEITQKLTQIHPDPDIPPYIAPVSRGVLKEKLLDVDDVDFEEFFENDINAIMRYYRHHMGTQIELKRSFGSIDLKDELKEIADDYLEKIKNAPDSKTRQKLQKESEATQRDIRAVRDILLGNFDKSDPDAVWSQAATVMRDLQFMTKMGGVTISSLPDVFRTIMVSGLDNVMGKFDGSGFSKHLKKMKLEELEEAGLMTEAVLASRLQSLAEIGDPLNRGTALTRFTGNAANVFSKVTLINYWNDMMKSHAALSAQRRFIKGLSSSDVNEISFLRENGIDEFHARIIKEQIKKHGEGELSGLKQWDVNEPNVRNAARIWKAALRKQSDVTIVTKGAGDLPLVANKRLGGLWLQFKSFLIASHSRVLTRAMQSRGGREVGGAIMGAVSMVALGMMVAAIKAEMYNRSAGLRGSDKRFDTSEWNRRKWIAEGVDRSGLIALVLEPINIMDKTTGIGTSLLTGQGHSSRYASRNLAGTLLGPSAGTIADIGIGGRALASPITGNDVSKSDIYAVRRLMPFQNAFVFRQMFDVLENKAGDVLDAQ